MPTGGAPLVLYESTNGGLRLTAVNPAAAAAGLGPGLTLADARALVPGLDAEAADLHADARALGALADWCLRFTPTVALDGADGLTLDVTGCAHLHGGEGVLLARVMGALGGLGFTTRAALADSRRMAWAGPRFLADAGSPGGVIVPPGSTRLVLAPMPVAALGLRSETTAGLTRLGLRRIGDVLAMPRGDLAARFGAAVSDHLDQALGYAAEVLTPRRPAPPYQVRQAFTEPLIDHGGVGRALARLLTELCRRLEAEGRGLRCLQVSLFRLDGGRRVAAVGTARPNRDPAHLHGLLQPHLDQLDLGLGVETVALAAPVTEPLTAAQTALMDGNGTAGDLATLVDRLAGRLGLAGVFRLAPCASHRPERSVATVPALKPHAGTPWPADIARPPRLFPRPEPVEAMAMVPDAPPLLFRWRGRPHRVARAEGPERIATEWWREAGAPDSHNWRDYYRVED
ncbi:MAG: DNA polymerase Y family protein, partial [Alphaproteobacteria bacterium]